MRPRKYAEKSTQVRLEEPVKTKVEDMAKRTGCDVSTILRLAVNKGLTSLDKNLPSTPK